MAGWRWLYGLRAVVHESDETRSLPSRLDGASESNTTLVPHTASTHITSPHIVLHTRHLTLLHLLLHSHQRANNTTFSHFYLHLLFSTLLVAVGERRDRLLSSIAMHLF